MLNISRKIKVPLYFSTESINIDFSYSVFEGFPRYQFRIPKNLESFKLENFLNWFGDIYLIRIEKDHLLCTVRSRSK